MLDYKYILYTTLGIGFFIDIFQEGLMSVGILLGWLIGLITMIQWNIEKNTKVGLNNGSCYSSSFEDETKLKIAKGNRGRGYTRRHTEVAGDELK